MRKVFLAVTAVFAAIMLTACAMSQEQIASSLVNLDNAYQAGTYEQAKEEIEKLDKAYNKMSEEQKSRFGELRASVENAVTNAAAIQDGLNNAQNFYDQKMYYEAQAELDKLKAYQIPPAEKAKFDGLQGNISTALGALKITESLQKIESLYNSGDYSAASAAMDGLDMSAATDEQNQKLVNLKQQISIAMVEAERQRQAAAAKTAMLGTWHDNSSNPAIELNVKSINADEAVISVSRTRGKGVQYSVSPAKFRGGNTAYATGYTSFDGFTNNVSFTFTFNDTNIVMEEQFDDGTSSTTVFIR